MSLVARKNT